MEILSKLSEEKFYCEARFELNEPVLDKLLYSASLNGLTVDELIGQTLNSLVLKSLDS